jgi:hypothetical protein
MKLLGLIKPLYFFAAFAAGLLLCYVFTPPPRVVIKYPTPFNANETTYKDGAETCYKYAAARVTCPSDPGLIKNQPVASH